MPTAPWIRPAPEPSLLGTALAKLSLGSRTALEPTLLPDALAAPLFFSCSLLSLTVPDTNAISTLKPHTALHRTASETTAPANHRRSDRTLGGIRCGPSRDTTIRAGGAAPSPEGKIHNRGENIIPDTGDLGNTLSHRGPPRRPTHRSSPGTPRFQC